MPGLYDDETVDLLQALAANPLLEVVGNERPEAGIRFELVSDYRPSGDQPQAIVELIEGVESGAKDQVLLGVTGSGKTFTMAHVIASVQKPTLILAPNKILAAQLYGEMKAFFPHNAVEYFVSYYDYYQPEAYVPRSDTYIEKTSAINEQIDRMRHSATRALLERDDVIIVASVSCIYGIGSPEVYSQMVLNLEEGPAGRAGAPVAGAGRAAVQEERPRFSSRDFPGARRFDRDLSGPSRGPGLAAFPVWRRDREHRRVRPADRRAHRYPRAGEALPEQPLCDPQADACRGGRRDQGRAQGAARGVSRQGPAARGRAAGAADGCRPRDDHRDRQLPRDRELFALSDRPAAGRAAADAVRVHPGRGAVDRR